MRALVAKRWASVAAVLGISLSNRAASAQADPSTRNDGGASLTLEWTAPPGCPTRDDVRHQAEALLGGPIEPHLERPLAASGTVTSTGERVELVLETMDNGIAGKRTLHGATCEEVTSAAALIIALAVDPKAVAAAKASTPVAGPTPPAKVAPETDQTSRPEARGARVKGLLEAAVVGDLGTLPGPAIGPSIAAGFGLDRLRFRSGASYYAPRFAEAPGEAGKGADVSLLVLALAGCYALTQAPYEVTACVDAEGGALLAEGKGFDHTNDAVTPWLAGGGSAGLTFTVVNPLTVRVGLGAVFPLGRAPVQFREITGDLGQPRILYRPTLASGRATVAFGVAF